VSRRDLLILATALHDLGKTGGERGEAHHAQRSVKAAQPILTRFGMSPAQKELVVSVIAYHAPSKLRQPGELWDTFVARGGLDGLYQALTGSSENPYPIETFLHYHADILGRRGSETSSTQVERRKQVTSFLLERYLREHPEQLDETRD